MDSVLMVCLSAKALCVVWMNRAASVRKCTTNREASSISRAADFFRTQHLYQSHFKSMAFHIDRPRARMPRAHPGPLGNALIT